MIKLFSGFATALVLAAQGDPINFELEVSKHDIRDYFGFATRIATNGDSFDYFTFPGDRSVGFSYGLVDQGGKRVSAWSLNGGGLGSSALLPIPETPGFLGAYFFREETFGFGVFDRDSLEPAFVKEVSIPDEAVLPHRQMQPLASGRAGFKIPTAQALHFVVIGLTGELELDLAVTSEESFEWFSFQPIDESITDDSIFLNWQIIKENSDFTTFTTLKASLDGNSVWSTEFSTSRFPDLQDRFFPTPDGGVLYAIPSTEDETQLIKIESDGQLGFARSINLRMDGTSAFKFENQSLYLGLENKDAWHLLHIDLTTGALLNSIKISGSEEMIHSQIISISEDFLHLHLEEAPNGEITQGHLVTIDRNWQVSNTRNFEINSGLFSARFAPNISVSHLSDHSTFLSLVHPDNGNLHGFTLQDSIPPSLASLIREIDVSVVTSESSANSTPIPLQLDTATSSNVTQGTTTLQPGTAPAITKVNIGFATPASERNSLQARIAHQEGDNWRLIFESRIGCSYLLWTSDQLEYEFSDTGESLEGTGGELFFKVHPGNEKEFFKIKEIVSPER